MHVSARETFMRHNDGQTPMASVVTYITPTGPDLLLRIYWSIGNDTWDEHYDLISHDHGRTFAEPSLACRSEPVAEGGRMSFGETAGLYHPERDRLAVITNYGFEPSREANSPDYPHRAHIVVAPPAEVRSTAATVTDFGFPQGFYMSFCHPMVDSRGRMLFSYQTVMRDTPDLGLVARGFAERAGYPGVMSDYWEAGVLVGTYGEGGEVAWRVGQPQPFDVALTSRGMCEPTIAELRDGRFAMICRGSNALWEGIKWEPRPGYKWLSYSEDGCETWSQPAPLPCADGGLIESSATGSWLFRSERNGKLYWIGNLCIHGIAAQGNHPRTPLVICEMAEGPVAIRRETITIIDQSAPHESEFVQHSNFRAYQERGTGDVILFMNRFFERGSWENLGWHDTDLYRYRIALD